VERAAGDNLNLPILKNILIKAENNRVSFSSTNLELAITHSLSGKIIENGHLTIPLHVFATIVNNLATERITLERKGFNLFVKTDNYEATIQGLNPEDFPLIPKISNTSNFIKINAGVFKEALNQTLTAAQFSDLRPEINGVLLKYGINSIKLAATDSFRLAERTILSDKFKSSFETGFEAIIPLKTAQEVARIMKSDEELSILPDENQILFQCGDQEVISRLIDGKFPDYEPIIPKTTATEIVVNRGEFLNGLKLAGVFAGRINDVRMKVGENNKFLEMHSADSALGENRYLVPIKINGPALSVAFNLRYLLDGLKPYNTEEVTFGLNGSDKPVVIKNAEDKTFFYILMPVKS
jgi:DNA polymerase-3 subunit beta